MCKNFAQFTFFWIERTKIVNRNLVEYKVNGVSLISNKDVDLTEKNCFFHIQIDVTLNLFDFHENKNEGTISLQQDIQQHRKISKWPFPSHDPLQSLVPQIQKSWWMIPTQTSCTLHGFFDGRSWNLSKLPATFAGKVCFSMILVALTPWKIHLTGCKTQPFVSS